MKIVHVAVTDNFAGVEAYVCDVSTELVERGHEVVVIGGETATMRRRLPAAVVIEPATSVARAARLIRRHLGDDTVVHAHMTAAEIAAALAMPRRERAPMVSTRHFAGGRGRSMPARLAGRMAARRIGVQISISEFVASAIGEPSVVIPNGVRNRPLGDHDETFVLVAQRLEREKSGNVAVRAWAASGLADEGWRMAFAGRGSHEGELRRLADELGVGSSIDWLGFVQNLPELMDRAGMFLATAPAEPFGLSVVEAMACGLPVVAAAGGAHLETAGAACPELLFAPGDAAGAGAVLRRLALDAPLRSAASAAAQRSQRSHFEIGDHVSRLLDAYESSLSPR